MQKTLALLAGISLLLPGCGAHYAAAPPTRPDTPVDPREPRAELRARIDLEPARGCEEKFDLVLYQNRAIDLIEWDAQRGVCVGRRVAIRYLSSRITPGQVAQAARGLSRQFILDTEGDKP